MDWNDFNMKTLNAQGDKPKAILHSRSMRLDLKLKEHLYLTGIFSNFTRDTK